MDKIDFWTTCSSNDIELDAEQMHSLERYHNELLYWNQSVNLISRKDENNVWERHILHSLTLLKYGTVPHKARVLDVGTGAGLPGIPLKIARPDLRILLTDSIRKKITATGMFAEHTGLKDISAMTTRVEDLANTANYRGHFDVIVSRAVAPISELLTWTSRLRAPGGVWYFLKGGDLREEIAAAKEVFPDVKITEQLIDMFGAPWFATEEKKVIAIR
jgi:16S rRNA (guanine527-N7)-methyltransferase